MRQVTVADANAVQTETLYFSKATDEPIALGLRSTVFYKADNFRLAYLGKDASQSRDEYEQALALAQQVYGRAVDLGDLTSTEKQALAEAIAATPEATLAGYQEAATRLLQAAQALVQAEYVQIGKQYGAEMELGAWTNNNVTTNQGQHWDGTSSSTYYEQKEGWSNQSWSMSMRQTITLPAGKYVLRATGRHAMGDMDMALTVSAQGQTLASVADFPSGDTGLGVNLEGKASFLATDGAGLPIRATAMDGNGATFPSN